MEIKILKKANKPIESKVIKPATLRQQKVIDLTKQAMIVGGKGGKSKAEILRKADYGKKAIDNPKRVFDTAVVKKEVESILQALEKERDAIIKEMKKKRHRAAYKDLGNVLDKVLGKIELLSGKPTDREETTIDPETKKMLDEVFRNHSSRENYE